ncbi:MAG TPA: trypsin-like peptidase domain-containing protein [Anaerolineae bacterium]|mgnify:CR=1 FL=1|nr:trypsin-like peptidase domain-containing protein [Anaerolineae bacterium]HQK14268.1 trypsin-like peptidase domain-containing protein [Anaerolineae bacterium]
MSKRMRWLFLCVAFLLALSCGAPNTLPPVTPETTTPPKATATPPEKPVAEATPITEKTLAPTTPTVDERQIRQNLFRATVQIIALVKEGGRFQPLWTGSGSILTPDGLILTNAHVASDPDPKYRPDALGVAITVRSDDTPELRYLAEIRAIDYDLDLAVIQIVSDLSGEAVDPRQLGLTYVPIGDSDALELGDLLHILGYPGIGGETITFTEGVVSGFTREPGVEGRAYIKTDATIAGGNSGGLAANLSGEIIGVPTQVGYGGAERFADCRYLADTNGDGYINENDNCIPVGGFINAIRPVNLAKSLIEAAKSGAAVVPTPEPSRPKPKTSGKPSFSSIVFAPAVDENDRPTMAVTQLPSGATELYACWEYSGMADNLSWEARWYLDGEYQEDISWAPAPWAGGESGNWWVSAYNENGLIEGIYRLELFVEGKKLAEGSIKVGGAATPAATPGEGLLIRGYVINASTKRGIEGALYVVLMPGITVEDWNGEEDQVYTYAQTDANGYFELPYALERNRAYSIIVWAEGYRPVTGDDIWIGDEPSPYDVEVALQRE